ncbi:hypothetical protein ACFOUO_03380 [Salinithrix halophila]|uniref:Uncharacterized protein n=1 Tax=Salinithrix halophila TaxID=1485204 RepID=A0ABV8JAD4_9BACL
MEVSVRTEVQTSDHFTHQGDSYNPKHPGHPFQDEYLSRIYSFIQQRCRYHETHKKPRFHEKVGLLSLLREKMLQYTVHMPFLADDIVHEILVLDVYVGLHQGRMPIILVKYNWKYRRLAAAMKLYFGFFPLFTQTCR